MELYRDANINGEIDSGDGGAVASADSASDTGAFSFEDVRPGRYFVKEVVPGGHVPTSPVAGSYTLAVGPGGAPSGVNLLGNDFANLAGEPLHRNQTATIGYWHNPNGQSLINSLNGGSTAANLGNRLAEMFPRLYGAAAGANNLAGKTNAQVAAFYRTLFNRSGQKLDAQALAVAFAVYVTNTSLAGNVAVGYGFEVSRFGTGASTYSVGSNGAAFGVPNNTRLTVLQILQAADARAVNGVLYDGDTSLRNKANTVFDGINRDGDI